jgi:pyruvate/2-oxoglutarate dehydrogenase complex dihydrolipoamide acyltransferase (E2) component
VNTPIAVLLERGRKASDVKAARRQKAAPRRKRRSSGCTAREVRGSCTSAAAARSRKPAPAAAQAPAAKWRRPHLCVAAGASHCQGERPRISAGGTRAPARMAASSRPMSRTLRKPGAKAAAAAPAPKGVDRTAARACWQPAIVKLFAGRPAQDRAACWNRSRHAQVIARRMTRVQADRAAFLSEHSSTLENRRGCWRARQRHAPRQREEPGAKNLSVNDFVIKRAGVWRCSEVPTANASLDRQAA